MNDHELQHAAAQLARSAPSSWHQFLAAYRVHCNDLLKQMITSPPDIVQVAQGRAKHGDELLRLLETAVATAEQIAKRNALNVRPSNEARPDRTQRF
jgi:hypothetical protein